MACHIGNDIRVDGLQFGQVILQIVVDARILQTDRIDVAGRTFGGADARIALPWHRRDALGSDRPKLAHIIEPTHSRVLERAGSGGDRILPWNARHLGGVLPLVSFVQIAVLHVVSRHAFTHPIPNVRV